MSWGLSGSGASWTPGGSGRACLLGGTPKPRHGPSRAESCGRVSPLVDGEWWVWEGAGGFTLFTQAHGAPGFVAACGAQPYLPSSHLQPAMALPWGLVSSPHPLGVQTVYCRAALKPESLKPILPLLSAAGLRSRQEPPAPPCEAPGPRRWQRGCGLGSACFLTLSGQPALGETHGSASGAVRPLWAGAARCCWEQGRAPQLGTYSLDHPGHVLTLGPAGHGVLLSRAWGRVSCSWLLSSDVLHTRNLRAFNTAPKGLSEVY